MTLVGADGTEWNLADGPVYILAGASGFGTPDAENWWRSSPSVNGSSWLGRRTPQREVSLPLEVRGSNEATWLEADRALWESLSGDGMCQLQITTPESVTRTLDIRYGGGGDKALDIDPMLEYMSTYELNFTAGDPFWHGNEKSETYTISAPVNLFPGPPFGISAAATISEGSIDNPGDEATWPTFEIVGPYSSVSVGVGIALVTLSTPVAAGVQRFVNMDPNSRTITDVNGVDKWLEATAADFAAVPPGNNIDLNMAVTGGTAGQTEVTVSIVPKYRRAW
jgi:hypothetical protein